VRRRRRPTATPWPLTRLLLLLRGGVPETEAPCLIFRGSSSEGSCECLKEVVYVPHVLGEVERQQKETVIIRTHTGLRKVAQRARLSVPVYLAGKLLVRYQHLSRPPRHIHAILLKASTTPASDLVLDFGRRRGGGGSVICDQKHASVCKQGACAFPALQPLRCSNFPMMFIGTFCCNPLCSHTSESKP